MEHASYRKLLTQLEGLTPKQSEEIRDRLQHRDEQTDLQRLIAERQTGQALCPHCGGSEIVRFGQFNGTQRFRCKASGCRKTFTALTGTPFARLRGKEQLLANADCMAEGLSVRKTAKKLGMSVRKAFHWRHKFLALLSQQKPAGMTGVVEADETFFPYPSKANAKTCQGRQRSAAVNHQRLRVKIEPTEMRKLLFWLPINEEAALLLAKDWTAWTQIR